MAYPLVHIPYKFLHTNPPFPPMIMAVLVAHDKPIPAVADPLPSPVLSEKPHVPLPIFLGIKYLIDVQLKCIKILVQ